MHDSYLGMFTVDAGSLKFEDGTSLLVLATVAFIAAMVGFIACMLWFRHEQNQWKKDLLETMARSGRDEDDLFFTGKASDRGELIAQFKVNQGKQVVSILESDGKRFIHVDGELSARERAKVIHYLKSEGFVA